MTALVPWNAQAKRSEEATSQPAKKIPEGMRVEVVTDRALLDRHVAAWDDLATHALEPNVFLESWLFLPALKAFGQGKQLRFLFLYRHDGTLCGFVPLQWHRRYKGLPVSALSLWEHDHCFTGTPLLHKEHAREALQAFLDWLATDRSSAPLFEFPLLPGEGPVAQLLIDEIRSRSLTTFQDSCFTRALLRRRETGEAYLQQTLSGNRRRDLNRKEKKLRELGQLDYRTLNDERDVPSWIDHFLRLEACGWKGREGTALACSRANETFFREAARAAFDRGQLHMLGLFLNDAPVALKCDFLSGPGSFFFKPGYDENYSRHSPGLLLEAENIRHLHALPGFEWMDSCTSPDNGMLNDLWLDRKILHTLVFATGRGTGRLLVSLLPLFRWLKRRLRRTPGERGTSAS